MKLAVLTTLAASAAAFAPAQTGKGSTALNAFESELGAQVRRLNFLLIGDLFSLAEVMLLQNHIPLSEDARLIRSVQMIQLCRFINKILILPLPLSLGLPLSLS